MRLYHQPRSRSARVLWLAEEAGAPIDVIVIAREEKFTDDYRSDAPAEPLARLRRGRRRGVRVGAPSCSTSPTAIPRRG